MQKQYELLTRGDEIFLLTEDTTTVNLKQAVGIMAMSVYSNVLNLSDEKDADEKKRLEEKILFQSKILDSLSNAYKAIRG